MDRMTTVTIWKRFYFSWRFQKCYLINRRDPDNFTYRQGRTQKKTRICIHGEPYWDNWKKCVFRHFVKKYKFSKLFFQIFQKLSGRSLEVVWVGFYTVFNHFIKIFNFFMKKCFFWKIIFFLYFKENSSRFMQLESHGYTCCKKQL